MFRHAVLWKMKNGSNSGEDVIKERLYALLPLIPQVRKMEIFKDVKHTPASYDLMLYTEFDSESDYLIYADHPEHVKVKKLIAELTCDRVVIDNDD